MTTGGRRRRAALQVTGVAAVALLLLGAALLRVQSPGLAHTPALLPVAEVPGADGGAAACPHLRPVDRACPRFVTLAVAPTGGLGHRLTELQVGWLASVRLNATWVIQGADAFGVARFGESYLWAYRSLGLAHGEPVTLDTLDSLYPGLTRVPVCPYMRAMTGDHATRCHVVWEIPHYMCCDHGDCFADASNVGLYERSKLCLRWKQRHGGGNLPRGSFNVVWHVRTGDIALHKNDRAFFARVADTVAPALAGLPVQHIVTYEGPSDAPLPAGFAFLPEVLPGMRTLPLSSTHTAYLVMAAADVLVTTGSGFAELPALLGAPGLVLHHVAKMRSDVRNATATLEWLSDAVDLYADGALAISADALRARVLAAFCSSRFGSGPEAAGPAFLGACMQARATTTTTHTASAPST
jgi:hypothetical protein